MALEKRPGCRFVLLGDERAMRTIGAIKLKGTSFTRIQSALLAHLCAASLKDTDAKNSDASTLTRGITR